MAGVLDQNVQLRIPGRNIQRQSILMQSAIEGSHDRAIQVDLCIILQVLEYQFAMDWLGDFRPIQDVAIGLTEHFHWNWLRSKDRPGQRIPEGSRFGQ